MTMTNSYSESSYLAHLTCNMDVRAHIGRSTGRSIPSVVASSRQEWQYVISTVRKSYWADELADLPPSSDIWWKSWKF